MGRLQPGSLTGLVALLLLAVLAAAADGALRQEDAADAAPDCPCDDRELCRPVTTKHSLEFLGFTLYNETKSDKSRYDWDQLTTVAWNEGKDPNLVCLAHAAGARVVLDGRFNNATELLPSAAARAEWVAGKVEEARRQGLDGINFDWEDPLPLGSRWTTLYSTLVAEAAEAFHDAIPGSQVSVDVPWSPYDVDGRNFEWLRLAESADIVFVMAYDMQAQIWGACVGSANSPPALVRKGLAQWLAIGVPADKLVLGLPWYGYAYECSNEAFQEGQDDLCALPAVSFRGAPCSDAAGPQVNYRDIAAAVRRGAGGRDTPSGERWDALVCGEPRWDKGQQSPWAPCRWDDDPPGLRRFQVWFDDPRSLAVKYGLVAELGLRGGGTWFLDALNYDCGGDDACAAETAAIWEAVRNTTSAS